MNKLLKKAVKCIDRMLEVSKIIWKNLRGKNNKTNASQHLSVEEDVIFGKNSVLEALTSGKREINKILISKIFILMLRLIKLKN